MTSEQQVRQPALFDGLEPAVDVEFSTARRIDLDATSWLEHVPGWLQGSDHTGSGSGISVSFSPGGGHPRAAGGHR
jgi:hypothetical protein